MRGVEVGIAAIVSIAVAILVFGRNSQSVALSNSVWGGANQLFGTVGRSVA